MPALPYDLYPDTPGSGGRMWEDDDGADSAPSLSEVSSERSLEHDDVSAVPGDDLDDDDPAYQTDEFRMWSMKVLPCTRMAAHDWTTCPFAHVGEKAVRRDPSCHAYTGVACPDMKRTSACPRGDKCPYSHNVFEYWLHPTRYRTQLCNDGPACARKPCFFAHSLTELRSSDVRPFVSPETVARVEREVALHGTACTSGGVGALAQGGVRSSGSSAAGDHDEVLASILAALRAERARFSGGASGTNHEIVINTLHSVLRQVAARQPAC
ncbi:hypothetical protein QBZ16_000763 [Prototheca wickerhamii]|uniref:C3H1-type domain-containing protein n=1 Tax=Prototheca wickerhamii TaxID=3111 RepID=A0AAD9MJ03_PROWI|nr:hypothetical protein QBZ16_000763 [Prototheca wickerhamii]